MDAAMPREIAASTEKYGVIKDRGKNAPFYSSIRTSEERHPCSCKIGWISAGVGGKLCSFRKCCSCCKNERCQSCEYHLHAVRWGIVRQENETTDAQVARVGAMKSACRYNSRSEKCWIDTSEFRRIMLHLETPPRARVQGQAGESLRSLCSSFSPTVEALVAEASRSLSSRVVAPRVVRIPFPSLSNTEEFGVTPICLLPENAVVQYEKLCDKAPRGRHRIFRGLSLVTAEVNVSAGDRFVFNDSDPGTAHPSMTPSLVLLRTVETKVRMGSSAITRIAITTFTFDFFSRSHAAFAGWQPCYVRDVLL